MSVLKSAEMERGKFQSLINLYNVSPPCLVLPVGPSDSQHNVAKLERLKITAHELEHVVDQIALTVCVCVCVVCAEGGVST